MRTSYTDSAHRATIDLIEASSGTNPDLIITLPSTTLIYYIDPMESDCWTGGSVTRTLVSKALQENRLNSYNPHWGTQDIEYSIKSFAQAHAERVAYFIAHGWDETEPWEVEVSECGAVDLIDGNHRLYALQFQELDRPVRIILSGCLDIAERLFDIVIP